MPEIATEHRFDLKFESIENGFKEEKLVEMKNWSEARAIACDKNSQFYAYISSGKKFEYYFSDASKEGMKKVFQNIFIDADKVEELWLANPTLFKQYFTNQAKLVEAAKNGTLINSPLLNFIK